MIREFKTGATRNSDDGKFDYEGFNHPIVEWQFACYMHKHRKLEDGSLRDGDNWQKGIPRDQLMKSLMRHVMDLHLIHKGHSVVGENDEMVTIVDALMGIRFNVNALALDVYHPLIVMRNEV